MNHLIHETSPYLLQHAHNPVEWYAWKPEAFERAKREDKPILVSIGYSTCHWCHVMERESFENEDIAAIMNEYFINIKVDREERPDVDHIYMEACQVISGNGGWPLNCFLTPDGRPFFAGTYYPPKPAYGRPSWVQLLRNFADAFCNKRDVVEDQANRLTEIIKNSDKTYIKSKAENLVVTEGVAFNDFIDKSGIDNIFTALRERFDTVEGGFGGAPKFPGTMCIQFLLEYYFYTNNQEALDHAVLSLNKMIQGGIYDQLGGGFARYATDREWLIPHFEKMLYDNALLVSVISEAYKLTKKDIYKETIEETLEFVAREMSHTEGGFFSAYDADSEGVEGKFYVWDKKEIENILGKNAELFCQFYDVTEGGNWEHKNILWRQLSYEEFSIINKIPIEELKNTLKACRTQLFTARSTRIWPGLDDKILLSWNALMISAYAKAYEALGEASYREIAERNLNFILKNFKKNDAFGLFHTFKNKKAQYDAFLEDYAFLIEALLDVYGVTFNKTYFTLAGGYVDYVLAHFYDESSGLFYFTSDEQADVIVRKKDLYDSAMPSGNSTMAKNLLKLSIMSDDTHYKSIALRMLQAIAEMVEKYPSSFAKWASTLLSVAIPPVEVAVVGEKAFDLSSGINSLFLPNKIVMASVEGDEHLPLLAGRGTEGGETLIYVCQNYACQMPVKTIEEMEHLMTKLNPL